MSDRLAWQPLQFNELTLDDRPPSLNEADVLPATPTSNTADAPLLARLSSESRERGYQEGVEAGKNDGFEQGKTAGYAQGYQQGFQVGQTEAAQQVRQELAQHVIEQKMLAVQAISDLVNNFQKAINTIDQTVVPKLVDLALLAAEKMVESLPKSKHKQLAKTVTELINQYPPLGKNVQLHINPDDVAGIESLLDDALAIYGWKRVVNPSIESGGCKLVSDTNEIDATVSSKWQVIANLAKKDSD